MIWSQELLCKVIIVIWVSSGFEQPTFKMRTHCIINRPAMEIWKWKYGGHGVLFLVLKSIFARNDDILKKFCKKGNAKNSDDGVLFKKKL